MSKKLIAEESARIIKMMGFDYKDNSHEVLSEQNIKKAILKEQMSKGAALQQAKQGGYNVIIKGKEIVPPPTLPPLQDSYLANYVSIETGLKPEGKQQLDKMIEDLRVTTNAVDPSNITFVINSSASSEAAGIQTQNGIPLDHPHSQPYNGMTADQIRTQGNNYLATQRGLLAKAYISEKTGIPLDNITVNATVSDSPGPTNRVLNFGLDYIEPVEKVIEWHTPRMGNALNATYYTKAQWNKNSAEKGSNCRILKTDLVGNSSIPVDKAVPSDDNSIESGQVLVKPNGGQRVLAIGLAGLSATDIKYGYTWPGGSDIISYQIKDDGTSKRWTTMGCGRTQGNNNIIGKEITHLADINDITHALSSSGYFTKEDVSKILDYLKQASPAGGGGDNPFTTLSGLKGVTKDNWLVFVKEMKSKGIGTGNYDKELALKNGAIMINGLTNKVIYVDGRYYKENDIIL